jgi:fatty acid desaturase
MQLKGPHFNKESNHSCQGLLAPKDKKTSAIPLPNLQGERQESTLASPYIFLFGHVYDVSQFAAKHPGGSLALDEVRGRDCTDLFAVYHPETLVEMCKSANTSVGPRGIFQSLHRGLVSDMEKNVNLQQQDKVDKAGMYERSVMQKEWDKIVEEIRKEGFFENQLQFYVLKIIWLASLLLLTAVFMYWGNSCYSAYYRIPFISSLPSPILSSSSSMLNSSVLSRSSAILLSISSSINFSQLPLNFSLYWYAMLCYMLSASFLGLFWQQIAFIGHDAGHNQLTGSVKGDYPFAWLVTALFGVSGVWWKRNHNVHHIHTNSIESDPDIQHLPVLSVVPSSFLTGFFSTYYLRFMKLTSTSAFLISHQHLLYYPIMALARFNLYLQSIALIFNPRLKVLHRAGDMSALILFWIMHISWLLLLPTSSIRWAYLLFSHAVAGITHVQITLSHFAMPTFNGAHLHPTSSDTFFHTQLTGTMNVSCPKWFDWFHGGLQFQIEHHLLPRLPRCHLRTVADKYVKPFALKFNLPYVSVDFITGNKMVYRQLKEAAYTARKLRENGYDFSTISPENTQLWQALNVIG